MTELPAPAPPVHRRSRRPPWLTRNLAVLCGVSFFQDAASEMLYPVLPLFLTGVLGAPVAVVGLIEGAADGVAALTKVTAGSLADRFRRRPLIGVGYGLAALAKAMIAVATVWPLVLAARCVDRVGKGLRGAPRDALLVVDVPPGRRGAAFGLHRAADTAGAVAGPLVGLIAYEALSHQLRPLFFLAVVPAIASVLLIRAVVEGKPPRPRTSAQGARAGAGAGSSSDVVARGGTAEARTGIPSGVVARGSTAQDRARAPSDVVARGGSAEAGNAVTRAGQRVPLPQRFWAVVAVLVVFSLVNFPDALLLLRAHTLGLDTAGVITAYILYNLAYAGLSYPAGALADRFSPRLVISAGLFFFAAGYIGLGLAGSGAAVFVLLPLYGGFGACTDGVGKAWASRLAPAERQGSAQGWYQGLTGGAILVAGIWAGLAWQETGVIPLLLAGTTALGVALLLLFLGRRLEGAVTAPR
ncbi:MAG: MFS transporter [Candidatus Dormibacteria bacterium]